MIFARTTIEDGGWCGYYGNRNNHQIAVWTHLEYNHQITLCLTAVKFTEIFSSMAILLTLILRFFAQQVLDIHNGRYLQMSLIYMNIDG